VRLATDPDPVRVRAAWVTDADIRAMVSEYAPAEKVRPLRADAA
jgi:S-DNA-T family DNA segregation ATPase FtsK/SpoIIIE